MEKKIDKKMDKIDRRERNAMIFQDTEKLCKENERLAAAIENSNRGQYVLLEQDDSLKAQGQRFSEAARVTVSKKRSLEAASAYARAGEKVCVHNFASASNPGGGVRQGSSAQEEALCRCSTLYFNISKPEVANQFHNLHKSQLKAGIMNPTYNDDCIYTPGVVVFKSDTDSPALMPQEDWYAVDVITCAAPNLRAVPTNAMNPGAGNRAVKLKDSELLELHKKRISRILDIAKKEQEDVVILGAFGCGAFCNPPRVVAEAMAYAVEKYRYDFKTIEFAVYCGQRETENYDTFSRRLGRL